MTTQAETMAEPGSPQKIVRPSKKQTSFFVTGLIQIIGGTIIILCGFVLVCSKYQIRERNRFDNSAIGIWGGIFLLATGIVGVITANRKCWWKGYLINSLISIVLLIVILILSAVAAAHNVHYYKEHPGYHHYDDPDYPDQHGVSLTKLSFHLLLAVVGSVELIVCILAAVFCCTVGICPADTQEHTVYYQMPAQAPPNLYQPNFAYPPGPDKVAEPEKQ